MELPCPLSAKFEGSFAYNTVKDRLPIIVTRIVDHLCREKVSLSEKFGQDCIKDVKSIVGQLSELKNHMQTNKPIKNIVNSKEGDGDDVFWKNSFQSHSVTEYDYPYWFTSSWLFVEVFMYRRIDEIFKGSHVLQSYDPFFYLKTKSLKEASKMVGKLLTYTSETLKAIQSMSSQSVKENVVKFVEISLWGNQYDLSLSSCSDKAQGVDLLAALKDKQEKILVWEVDQLLSYLDTLKNIKGTVGMVLDNAGFELVADFCLMTILIEAQYCTKFNIYTKIKPYFVSDTTNKDIEYMMQLLSTSDNIHAPDIVKMWKNYLASGVWVIKAKPFWTAPQDFSQMEKQDNDLYSELSQCQLLVFKGDLNYRKLTGDLDWPLETTFQASLRGFQPTSLLTLRTVKGGPVVGLDEQSTNVIKAKQSCDWKSSGDFGMAQFVSL